MPKMMLQKEYCANIGGINRLWLAGQAAGLAYLEGAAGIILDRKVFCEVELDSGSYQESYRQDDGGGVFESSIGFKIRKDRPAIAAFEQQWRGKQLLCVTCNRNGEYLIFKNLQLTRQKNSGEFAADFNGFQFQLTGNNWQASTYVEALEAIFWFHTQFQAGNGQFNPAFTFSGIAEWHFANGSRFLGNSIDTDGIAEGLNGDRQMICIDSERSASEITALHFRNNVIAGELRLDLLPNLQTGDFALNQIESVRVGDWVNQSGVVIELRNNQLSSEAQQSLVAQIATKFVGASSDLKIGLFNQVAAPSSETIELAIELYSMYGIEIHLPAVQAQLTIGHE